MAAEQREKRTLEYSLLGLLKGDPQHGYALFQKLQDTRELSRIWHVKRSKVYYLLEKLENQGLLSSRVVPHDTYPDRKTYQLTDQGRRCLQEWVQQPVTSGRDMRVSFLSRLFFALQDSPAAARRLVKTQLAETRSWLTSLTGQWEELEDSDFLTDRTFQFRIGQVEAMLDWLRECRDQI